MKNIQIIQIKSEIGAGTRGASLGIDALRIVSMEMRSDFFLKYPVTDVPNNNHLLFERNRNPYAKRIQGIFDLYKKIAPVVKQTIEEEFFPLVLSGDHSIAAGTIAGLRQAFPDKRLGVIWIDAHADIHSPYTTPSGNMHGMPVAMILSEDNLHNKTNDPIPETLSVWNEIKNYCSPRLPIDSEDIAYISVRNNEPAEDYLISHSNIRNFTTREIRQKGSIKVAHEALSYLSDCDKIYVSFDVDSLDPTLSRGTGTPASNGLMREEAQELLKTLLLNEKVCCFEVVEINPLVDASNSMAKIVFPLILEASEVIEQRLM